VRNHLPTGPADCGICHRTPEGAPVSIGIESITAAGRRVHANGIVDLAEGLK
jgi:hypothetical protein